MSLGAPEIILIVLAILLLFGATKLPELARSVGRSMRIFKSEVHQMNSENEAENSNGTQTVTPTPQALPAHDEQPDINPANNAQAQAREQHNQ